MTNQDHDTETARKSRRRAKEKRIPSGATGALLKKAREEQGLSLQDVSDYLNIRKGLLTAIEEGDYDELPATAYTLGFMKSYALYVGLDPQQVADQFKQ